MTLISIMIPLTTSFCINPEAAKVIVILQSQVYKIRLCTNNCLGSLSRHQPIHSRIIKFLVSWATQKPAMQLDLGHSIEVVRRRAPDLDVHD